MRERGLNKYGLIAIGSIYKDTEEKFEQRQLHDKIKNEYAIQNNITLIRIPYTHYNNLCLEDLLENSNFIIRKE